MRCYTAESWRVEIFLECLRFARHHKLEHLYCITRQLQCHRLIDANIQVGDSQIKMKDKKCPSSINSSSIAQFDLRNSWSTLYPFTVAFIKVIFCNVDTAAASFSLEIIELTVSHFITLQARFGKKVIPLHATVVRCSERGNAYGFSSTHS